MADRPRVEEQVMELDPTAFSQQTSELEQLYRTAPVGLCFLDTELRYIRINERLAMMNGKPAAAHIGRPIREVSPELAPTLEPVFRELLETGVSVRDLEVTGTTPADPAERTWLCNFARVTSSKGRVLGVTGVVQEVTEPKQDAERAALIQEYLDTVLLNLPVGVAILEGEDFRYFRINKVLADMNGLSVEDHLGKTVAQVLPHARNILSNLRKVRDEGETTIREFTARLPRNPDQDVRLMDFHFPITVAGETRAVGVVVLDITARSHAEEALRRSEARYHHAFESTPISIWEVDCSEFGVVLHELKQQGVQDFRRYFDEHPDLVQRAIGMFKVLDINQGTVEMFGASSKDQMLTSIDNSFVPETLKVFREELIAVGDGARHFEAETVVQTLQGKKLNVLLAIAFSGDESRLTRAIVTLSDITERKRAQHALQEAHERLEQQVKDRTTELLQANTALRAENAERREAQQELEKSEHRLRMLLETTHAIPWAADPMTFRFTYIGPRAVEVLGYPTDQWYVDDFWPDHIHPDDRDAAVDFCLTHWQHKMEFEFEYRMIAADGHIVWIHDLVKVARQDGEPTMLHGFMIDVSEQREAETNRKAAEHELRLLQQELAHVTRVATVGEFAGSVAHEINQPLAAIVMNAQAARRYLDRPTPDTDEASEALTAIAEDAKRAGEVIHRLRGLLEKREPVESRLDINTLATQMVTLLQSDAMARGISLRLDLETNLPLVLGDQVLLQQVVMNLMLNGFEAMDDVAADRRTLTLETSIGDAGAAQIAVRDSGVGLDPEHLHGIFEPFYSTKLKGMGMGLVISRSIVEAHGGRLWATPNADHGTTFRVTLPPV